MSELAPVEPKQPVHPVMRILMSPATRNGLLTIAPKCDPDELMARARLAVVEKPDLADCTPESILLSLKKAAASGFAPSSFGRDWHLVPRWSKDKGAKEANFQIDYKGYIKLAKDNGLGFIKAEIVHEKDDFAMGADENGCHITHVFRPGIDRGIAIGAYSMTKKRGHPADFEWMTKAEILSIRARSPAKSGPWVTDEMEMWKKTVLRRHSKRWQLSPGAHQAIMDDADRLEIGAIEKPKPRIVYPNAETLPAPEPAMRLTDGEPIPNEKGEFEW